MVTPEGIEFPIVVGSRGARIGALILDFVFLYLGLLLFIFLMVWIAGGLLDESLETLEENVAGAQEFLIIIFIVVVFLARYGYFLMFEQGARDTQFGLDPANGFGKRKPGKADNLHWGHFAESEDALAGMSHAPADAPWGTQAIERAVWGRNSADTAKLCLQRKVRMLFPARTLIDAETLANGG